ncbi:MAG: beta strand repeat-containing protein [Pyrinomonadaceae bacterium]
MFLSLALVSSLLTPLVPAAFGAGAPGAAVNPSAVAVVPAITATKSDAFPDPDNDGRAVPGDTITYTVQINNNGTDATGVVYSDTVDANTTFVPGSITTTPIAINDTYSAIGNVRISVPAASGLTSNDTDPDGGPITAVAGTTTSTNNGNVTVNADGSFTYNPAPGFEGADTFTYTINGASAPNNTATVTVNVAGMIWFIDAAAAGGDGRLTSPFNSISAFNAFAADQPNDNIFLYSGNYTGGLALQSGQTLIGQGSTASLATVTGLTPPSYSDPFPATGGANPVIGGTTGITIATNNLIRGVTIANTGGTGIAGTMFGTLAVADTTVNSTTADALSLDNGQLNATFQSISSSGSGTAGVLLKNISVGSVFSGGPTTINNRFSTGIDLDSVQGSISFGATTVPNQNAAGGYGVRVRNSGAAVSFASATISDANQLTGQIDANSDGIPETDGDGDAIFLSNNTGSIAVNGGTLSNCGNDCVDARESTNVVLTGVSISNPGQDVPAGGAGIGGHGVFALNLKGTNGLSGGSVSGFNLANRDGVLVLSNMFTQTFNVAGTTIQNGTGNSGLRGTASGTANLTLVVGGATNNVATNSTFSNITGSAVTTSATDTATLGLTVQNSTFQNAPINGKTNVSGTTLLTGHATFNVLNNTFNNVVHTASTAEGAINLSGGASVAGNTFSANVSGNNLSGVGGGTTVCGAGSTFCAGSTQAISILTTGLTNISGTILVDGNTVTAAQQGGLLLDTANTGPSAIAAKVTNNVFGTNASRVGLGGASVTVLSGMRIIHRTDGAPAANVLVSGNSVRNGSGSAGSALNSPGIFLRTQNNTSMDVTATGNDVDTNTSGTVAELRADTSTGNPTLCLDASGNTLAAGAGLISLTETNGALNVEQASAAALATANGIPAANVTQSGSPQFGITCLAPVASLRLNNSRGDQLAANGARGFGLLAGARTPVVSELLPGFDSWRTDLKWLGARSFNYAAGHVALGGLTDTVVRPAREAAPAVPVSAAAPVAAPSVFSGDTFNVNIGTMPAGRSMTITFQVTIDTPFNATQVSNQGTVSGTNFSPVVTDDPSTGAFGDPTVTPVGSPATISCPANITTGTDPGQFSASVAFTVTASGQPAPTVDCKIGATSITSPHTFPVGTTAVQCTATNGIGSPASCSFNVTVNDTQTPTISCPANITTTTAANSCDASVDVGTPSVNDNDPNVAVNGTRSDAQPLNAPYPLGTTTITWTATDTAGNSASCQQTVTVNDATAPVITLNGSASMTVECHTSFTDPGATASDNCGGSVSVNVSGSVDVNSPGTYTLNYNATDAAGNHAAQVTRTVTVQDTTAPVITLNGASSMTVECHTSFSDPGATASDSCDSSVPVTTTGSVNVNVPGTYTLHYNASDDSGNAAAEVTRTVTVVDTIAPVITVNGPNPMTVECHTTFTDPGATATDACDTNVPVTTTGSVNVNVPGPYVLTYNASDDSGNNATPKTRTVIVVDTTGPVITVNSLAPSLWPANHKYVSFNVTDFVTGVSDGCDTTLGISSVVIQKITSDETENGNGDGNTTNDIVIAPNCKSFQVRAERDGGGNGRVYSVTFAVTDSTGNVGTQTVKIVVQHNPGETPIDSGVHYTVNGSCGP